jgi:hypothetical protein
VPGLLGRIEWDLRQHQEADAPYLKLTPNEYWQRNCFSAIESGEREVGSVVDLLGGADNICVSSDFPHFDSSFPEVSTRVMTNPSITLDVAARTINLDVQEAELAKRRAAWKPPEAAWAAFLDKLFSIQGKFPKLATQNDYYMALAYTVRDMMLRQHLTPERSLELNRLFVEYQKFFGEAQTLGKQILKALAGG